MSNHLVEESRSKVTIGHVGLGIRNGKVEKPGVAVHDGDTITARALANIAIRMLGFDTPEVSYTLPGETVFRSIGKQPWQDFLADPFAGWPEATQVLGPALRAALEERLGPGAAENHWHHADRAHKKLQELVKADIATYAGDDESRFHFFLRYAHDVVDRYGRLLAYVNVDVEKPEDAPALTYNERMLAAGMGSPYFIFPSLDPFKKQPNLLDAVPEPEQMAEVASTGRFGEARRSVAAAREARLGIFGEIPGKAVPLRVQPFELRFLAGRRAPDRWVIDLGKPDGVLMRPVDYYTIENLEDRLYIPLEFVPLFERKGWRRA